MKKPKKKKFKIAPLIIVLWVVVLVVTLTIFLNSQCEYDCEDGITEEPEPIKDSEPQTNMTKLFEETTIFSKIFEWMPLIVILMLFLVFVLPIIRSLFAEGGL